MTTVELVNSAIAKGWMSKPPVSNHKGKPPRRFSDEQVATLKKMKSEGVNLNDCAKFFGVARTTIYYVLEGRK
jgi:hypothetical protein